MNQVRYTKTHEWIELEVLAVATPRDETIMGTVGITKRGQLECGEITYVELPEEGDEYEQYEPAGKLELVTGDTVTVNAPVTGEVIEVNKILEDDPDVINRAPEDDGWIFKIHIEIPQEISILMDLEEYNFFDEDKEEKDEDEEEDYYYEDDDEYLD